MNRGLLKVNIKDYSGAKADFHQIIEIDPNNATAYFNRGVCKILLEEKESGCLDLNRAGELGDTSVYATIEKYCNN